MRHGRLPGRVTCLQQQLVNDEAGCTSFQTFPALLCITGGWSLKTTFPGSLSCWFPVGVCQWEALMGAWQAGGGGEKPGYFIPSISASSVALLVAVSPLCFKLPQGCICDSQILPGIPGHGLW